MQRFDDPLQLIEDVLRNGTLKQAVDRQHFGSALREVSAEIEGLKPGLARLERLVQTSDAFMDHLEGERRVKVSQLASEIERVGRRVQDAQTQDDLKAVRFDLRDTIRNMERLEELLREGWKCRIRQEFGNYRELPDILSQCQIPSSLCQRLRDAVSRGGQLEARFPPTPSDLESLQQLALSREAILYDLVGAGVGEQELTFLLAVGDGTATLAHVTPKVLEWLVGAGSHMRFRVLLGSR